MIGSRFRVLSSMVQKFNVQRTLNWTPQYGSSYLRGRQMNTDCQEIKYKKLAEKVIIWVQWFRGLTQNAEPLDVEPRNLGYKIYRLTRKEDLC